MSDKEARLFEVQPPERPAVQVQAVDRLRAVAAAAREWGDRWTEIAPTWARRRSRSGKAGGRHDS